jgi:hypothetical protein
MVSAQSPPDRSGLGRILSERGIPFEEEYLFLESRSGIGEEYLGRTGSGEPSILISLGGAGNPDRNFEDGEDRELSFVVAFPMDRILGDGDFSFSLRTALELAGRIRAEKPAMDFTIAFLGDGDLGQAGESPEGLPGFFFDPVNALAVPERTLFWYLDMDGTGGGIRAAHGTGKVIAAREVLQELDASCRSLDIVLDFAVPYNEALKMGFYEGPELLYFLQRHEIIGLYLDDYAVPGGNALTGRLMAELILHYAGTLTTIPENPDYHYSVFTLGGRGFFLSEYDTLRCLLAASSAFLLFFLIRSFVHRPRIRVFVRYIWIIPFIFLLFLVSFTAAGLPAGFLFRSLKSSWPASLPPLLYALGGFKLLFTLGIFSALTILFEGYRIPGRSRFFGSSAAAFAIADTLAALYRDMSLAPFFVCILFFLCLGILTRKALLVYLCSFLTMLRGALILVFLIRSGQGNFGGLFLSESLYPAFVFTLVLMPTMLLFQRGRACALRKRRRGPLAYRLLPALVLSGLAWCIPLTLFFTGLTS